MKRFLTSLAGAAILTSCLVPLGAQAASARAQSMNIQVLAATGPRSISKPRNVTFHLKTVGIRLDARHMGKANKSGYGHIQVYLDKIPTDAYSKKDFKHNWLAAVATPTFSLRLSKATLHGAGKHKIIVALAKNSDVLYRAPTASFTITVK